MKYLFRLLLVLFLFVGVMDVYSQDTTRWTGLAIPADSAWNNPANWSGSLVPGTSTVVEILPDQQTFHIKMPDTIQIKCLRIQDIGANPIMSKVTLDGFEQLHILAHTNILLDNTILNGQEILLTGNGMDFLVTGQNNWDVTSLIIAPSAYIGMMQQGWNGFV